VIFAFPSSVSITAPLTKMFCLARNVFDGVSSTFFIADFLDFPFVTTFATLPRKETNFLLPPFVLSAFVFFSPSFTILV